MNQAIIVTDGSFDKLLKDQKLLMIDFWSKTCGPCRAVSPIVDELSIEYAGKMVFGKIDVEENKSVYVRYGVQSLPTLLIFKNGKPYSQINGPRSKAEIKKSIDAALK
ncbi:MAG: thioredoxin [Chloroflexi bacterium]|nr:thioredoxin [Chloroflexota bacterium]